MPQFSDEYLEEKYKDSKPLPEGYLAHFLNISENIDEFPFETQNVCVELTVNEQDFIKILREIEEINTDGDIVIHSTDIPDEYELQIGTALFKFKKD